MLKADKMAFFTACNRASKATDYLRGLAPLVASRRARNEATVARDVASELELPASYEPLYNHDPQR